MTGDAEWWSSDRNSDAWIFKVDAQGELGCGIGSDTDAVAHAGGSVVAGSGHAYTAADTTAVAQASGAVAYSAAPEVIVQCDSP